MSSKVYHAAQATMSCLFGYAAAVRALGGKHFDIVGVLRFGPARAYLAPPYRSARLTMQVQYNDPDPEVWIPLYAIPAVACAYEALRGNWKTAPLPRLVFVALIGIAAAVGATVITTARAAFEKEGLTAELYEHETVREVSGLAIVVAWMLFCVSRAGSDVKPVAADGKKEGDKKGLALAKKTSVGDVVATLFAVAIPGFAISLGVWWYRRLLLGLSASTCSQQ